MSRRRYISTELSTDIRLAELAEHGIMPLLLYTWAIPHFDDWGRMSGDPRQFKLTVCPALDISSSEVLAAIEQIENVGLWNRYVAERKWVIAVPSERWFKHQSYIGKDKRLNDEGSNFKSIEYAEITETPQNTEDHRESPKNTVSFSSSSSLSLSSSSSKEIISVISTEIEFNPYKMYQEERFGYISSSVADELKALEEEYTAERVCRAMKEAVINNVKTIPYFKKILREWKLTGHDEPWTLPKKENPQQRTNVKQFKNSSQSGKPIIPMMPTDTPSSKPTPEELEAMKQRAARLDEKFSNKGAG